MQYIDEVDGSLYRKQNKKRTENVSVFLVYFLYNCCSTLPSDGCSH
jgi:hypothetical protein